MKLHQLLIISFHACVLFLFSCSNENDLESKMVCNSLIKTNQHLLSINNDYISLLEFYNALHPKKNEVTLLKGKTIHLKCDSLYQLADSSYETSFVSPKLSKLFEKTISELNPKMIDSTKLNIENPQLLALAIKNRVLIEEGKSLQELIKKNINSTYCDFSPIAPQITHGKHLDSNHLSLDIGFNQRFFIDGITKVTIDTLLINGNNKTCHS